MSDSLQPHELQHAGLPVHHQLFHMHHLQQQELEELPLKNSCQQDQGVFRITLSLQIPKEQVKKQFFSMSLWAALPSWTHLHFPSSASEVHKEITKLTQTSHTDGNN